MLYRTLEVPRTATQQEIKKSYYALAKQYHPDKKEHNDTKFKEVVAAYEVLSDVKKRQEYDLTGKVVAPVSNNKEPTKDHALNITYALDVTLAEVYSGATRELRVTRFVICSACSDSMVPCPTCGGTGFLPFSSLVPGIFATKPCHGCKGDKQIIKGDCSRCDNRRMLLEESKKLHLSIPAGSKAGDQLIMRGEANQALGRIPGDVVVTIRSILYDKAKYTIVDDDNISMTCDITVLEALVGFEDKEVVLPNNERLLIRGNYCVSPSLTITGKGLLDAKKNTVGDLLISLNVVYPQKKLSEQTVATLKSINW